MGEGTVTDMAIRKVLKDRRKFGKKRNRIARARLEFD